jgi:hypothetical protein
MCYEFKAQPLAVPLRLRRAKSGKLILTYSLLLGKVTEKKYKHHRSPHGFTYPIGKAVSDSNAIVGDHDFGLHFAATPFDIADLDEYGSHVRQCSPGLRSGIRYRKMTFRAGAGIQMGVSRLSV